MLVAAFDPGRNIGYALVDDRGGLLESRILSSGELDALSIPHQAVVVIGNGTGSTQLHEQLRRYALEVHTVDETGSSLEGRWLYFRHNPPAIPWRWLPRGLWSPPGPIDDYAAYAIALRFLGKPALGGRARDLSQIRGIGRQ